MATQHRRYRFLRVAGIVLLGLLVLARIQDALRARGLLEEEPSGQLDQATSAALRRFQASQKLAATGAPDRETLHRLGLDPQEIYRTVPEGGEPRPNR